MRVWKLFSFLLVSTTLIFSSCGKDKPVDCPPITAVAPQEEIDELTSFIEEQEIEADYDERGFYYKINEQGEGKSIGACDEVTINYSGSLINDQVFDANDNISFPLVRLITGWRVGLPLINVGGDITLYLPPSFGYGVGGSGMIPGNAILIFDIQLLDVK